MRLDVNNLNFSYADKTIIKNLSFSVPDGAFISILGPSGCGKSTLLNVLSGLLKPQSGEIRIDDVPVRGTSRELAYMPQNDLLFQWRTILDNVCLYGEIHHQNKEMRQETGASSRWRVSAWQDVKINIRMSSPAVCASAQPSFVRRCVRRAFIFWMSRLAHWMSSPAAICRTGFEQLCTGLHQHDSARDA